ncbi:MAG: PQQ-dependent dehydrogenase, methanol/ethanol family [Gemmatimonadales bacterium]|nr:PQQ-dependent dehydrogenase, methanol/ethanol family [Gemmatimonadales bacterium]
MKNPALWGVLLLATGCGGPSPSASPANGTRPGWVDADRLKNADREPDQWLTGGGGPNEQYYSALDRIDQSNVDRLGLAWEYTARSTRGRVQHGMQGTALVVDGVMYLSGPWSVVYALDARTGQERWRYDPNVDGAFPRRGCCGVSSRGVQVWKGKVYLATLDGYLVALEAGTGRELWRVDTFIDRSRDYTITGAPHLAGDKIVVGNSGADFGVRGYVSAYDLETGAFAWRFFTVPGDPTKPFEHPELEAASRTWDPKSAWEAGLGGTVWGMMAYDADLDLLYIGTGNSSPYPIWFRSPSGGDNLYLASVVAIKASTGRMAWYYQTVPGEIWDYTVSSNLVLAELDVRGTRRKVLMTAPKNGFYYVLDRATGAFLSAEKYVRVNWASHVDSATGRPVITPDGWYEKEPKLVFPSSYGGHNWMPMSFSPKAGLAFIPTIERGMVYQTDPSFSFKNHHIYQGVVLAVDPAITNRLTKGDPSLLETKEFLKAWDPVTQRERWRVPLVGQFNGGVLSTAGDLVIQGQSDGHLVIRRAADGTVLRDIDIGTGIMAAPMSYAIDGEQYIAVMAGYGGGVGAQFYPGVAGYRHENYPRILAFKLGGGPVPLPPVRVEPPIPAPPPVEADAATIARGGELFGRHCVYCHAGLGGAASAYPDLTRLPADVHQRFRDIVLGGSLVKAGMASFADVLDEADADAVHAYLMAEQRRAYEARGR